MLWLNIFLILKVKFSMTYDVVLLKFAEWPNSVWLTLNCVILSKLTKLSFQLLRTSLCSGCHDKTSAGSPFQTFNKRASASLWRYKCRLYWCTGPDLSKYSWWHGTHKVQVLICISHTHCSNNNNNNKHDNVYGAVIMAEPLREFTRFIWWM